MLRNKMQNNRMKKIQKKKPKSHLSGFTKQIPHKGIHAKLGLVHGIIRGH